MKPADGGPLQEIANQGDFKEITGSSRSGPDGLTIGSDGTLYVTDGAKDSVFSVDPVSGDIEQLVSKSDLKDLLEDQGNDHVSVSLHAGIVAGQDGMVYIASDGNPDTIFAIDTATGETSVLASGDPFNDLDVYMTVAPNGDLIVSDDSGADTIYRIETSGENSGEVSVFLSEDDLEALTGGDVDLEGGIAFDPAGNFYVAEENSDNIYTWPYDADTGTLDTESGGLYVSEDGMETAVSGDVDLEGGIAFAAGDGTTVEAGADQLYGGAGDDFIDGGAGSDLLDGGADDDFLRGGDGDDTLIGGTGEDILEGGAGDDTFMYGADGTYGDGAIADNVGGAGDDDDSGDWVSVADMNKSDDTFIGGSGEDTLKMTDGNDALFLDDGGSGPNISGIEKIEAGAGNDVVDLTSNDFVYGDVTIDGGEGDDVLWASLGDDELIGGTGDDMLDGGAGDDTAVFEGLIEDYDIYVDGDSGELTVAAKDGSGTDTLKNIEHVKFRDDNRNSEESYSVTVSDGSVNITPDTGSG